MSHRSTPTLFKRAYSGKAANVDLIVSWLSAHADPEFGLRG